MKLEEGTRKIRMTRFILLRREYCLIDVDTLNVFKGVSVHELPVIPALTSGRAENNYEARPTRGGFKCAR